MADIKTRDAVKGTACRFIVELQAVRLFRMLLSIP